MVNDGEVGDLIVPATNEDFLFLPPLNTDLYRAEIKRQGLIPFPRVGRSGYKPQPMWFPNHSGSRLQKRSS